MGVIIDIPRVTFHKHSLCLCVSEESLALACKPENLKAFFFRLMDLRWDMIYQEKG